jgi:DNA-binding NarL/FixJ family response regulator
MQNIPAVASGVTAVIIEDHAVTLEGLAYQLSTQFGITVLGTTSDWQEGLKLAEDVKPDAIVLDLHLPNSPGPMSLVRSFRQAGCAKVLIFSAEDRELFVETAIENGAHAFIHKSKPASAVARRLLELVGGGQPTMRRGPARIKFSESERSILRQIAAGRKYQDIANSRATSSETVRKQCDRLLLKLQLSTREELIAWAAASGFAEIDG